MNKRKILKIIMIIGIFMLVMRMIAPFIRNIKLLLKMVVSFIFTAVFWVVLAIVFFLVLSG